MPSYRVNLVVEGRDGFVSGFPDFETDAAPAPGTLVEIFDPLTGKPVDAEVIAVGEDAQGPVLTVRQV